MSVLTAAELFEFLALTMYACMQDVVWEKLDAIDGDTVFVTSTLQPPGETSVHLALVSTEFLNNLCTPIRETSQEVLFSASCCSVAAHVADLAAACILRRNTTGKIKFWET